KITMYYYRTDDLAVLELELRRGDYGGGAVVMATLTANTTTMYESISTESITNPTIDNLNYNYGFRLKINPNDDDQEVRFMGIVIEY
ncbi:unnamed protein product, partial [marine sediment metagenome]